MTARKPSPLELGGSAAPLLKIDFKTDSAVTLGGFLTERLQHMPTKGERITHGGYCFQIQKAGTRRIQQVLIFAEPTSSHS